MGFKMAKIDVELIKQSIDCREYIGQYTQLSGTTEQAGPCPKCGGYDRFHVLRDGWFCRQCTGAKFQDIIAFRRWFFGESFIEATAALGAVHVAPSVKVKPLAKAVTAAASVDYTKRAKEAAARLATDAGQAGRDYLLSRGITEDIWQRYGIGFSVVSLPGTNAKIDGQWKNCFDVSPKQPAISIPWFLGRQCIAIQYRFFETHEYTDINGRPAKAKNKTVGNKVGRVYGGHSVNQAGDRSGRTLFLCEGEINALSIATIAPDHVDVLSIGGQDQKMDDAVVNFALGYAHVIVWVDERAVAQRLRKIIRGCGALVSPRGLDANDLLGIGLLREFIGAKLQETEPPQPEPVPLPADLWQHFGGADGAVLAMRYRDSLGDGYLCSIYANMDGGIVTGAKCRDYLDALLTVGHSWT